jgi:nucleotide-binding universal stress UspA family protein
MIQSNGHFQKILVGYDGSKDSEKALDVALSVANGMDARVEVLAVAQAAEAPGAVELQTLLDDARAHYEKSLRRIGADAAKENGIQIESQIAVGHPAEQIIRRAQQSLTDLIVVGRWGLMSEQVLRYAPCPVLVTG